MTHARYEYPQRMPIFSPPLAVLLGLAPAPITPRGILRNPHRCKDSFVEPGQSGVICKQCGDEHAPEYVSKAGVCKQCRADLKRETEKKRQRTKRAITTPAVMSAKLDQEMYDVLVKPMTVAEVCAVMHLTENVRKRIGHRLAAAAQRGVIVAKQGFRNSRNVMIYCRRGHESQIGSMTTEDQQAILAVMSPIDAMTINQIAQLLPRKAASESLHQDRVRFHIGRLLAKNLIQQTTKTQRDSVSGPHRLGAYRIINQVS